MSDSKSSVMERLGLSGSAGESIYKKLLVRNPYLGVVGVAHSCCG